MPIYEYRCASCGHQQEFLQRVSDAPFTRCTQCGKETFSKMVTAAGFHLKGGGWYATDFKNGSSKPAKPEAAAQKSKPERAPQGESKSGSAPQGESKSGSAPQGESKSESAKESAAPAACGSGGCPACR